MMDNFEILPVLQYLNRKFGAGLQTEYYQNIRLWKAWWRGYVKSFHSFRELSGDRVIERKLYSMKMAKKVCEDWASILLNEKTEIAIADKTSREFVQGPKQTTGVLGANDFWERGNELVERAFYSGTGAFVLRLENMLVGTDGSVLRSPETRVGIDYLDAMYIYPLSLKRGKITEAVFASVQLVRGKYQVYLEEHMLQNGNYVITNELFDYEAGTLVPKPLPDGIAPSFNTGSPIPWFSIIEPNISNNMPYSNGLGLSVYADAIDELQNVDIAFNNFVKDFKLGGKKVFYNKSMVRRTEDGAKVTPDDVAQQLFLQVDADSDVDADLKTLVQEYNPQLRVEENTKGIQAALDYLSFKCGLGTRFYTFEGGTVQTATQYTGERQDLVQNANKHYIVIERALQGLVRGILYIGREILGLPVKEDTDIEIKFEDSYIIDKEAERARDKDDVRDGIMPKWSYRMKWYGEDEETAKRMIAEAQGVSNDELMGFGQNKPPGGAPNA
jgi:A118 family predicted phage portal protein